MKYKSAMFLLFTATLLGGPSMQRTIAQANPNRILVPDPSWNCGMSEGIPNPESGTLVFEARIGLDTVLNVGRTPYGERKVAVAREGTVSGTRLSGTVTSGALDFELKLQNGVIEIEQILVLKSSEGKYIYARAAGVGVDSTDVRVVMDFEAPNASDSAWLNSGKYVARRLLDAETKILVLRVYDVTAVPIPPPVNNVIRISKPPNAPAQPWDYRTKAAGEKQGRELITETVTLSPSLSVGPSKRGNRNIIPITGGELSGRISGKVLAGGADYQNLSPPATIDARYLWQTNDGEIILVRNAGAFGALVPTFEVRTDGPYAWLNTGTYLSSNPGMKPGGVGITMYDSVR